jgi:hypothetical protein
VCDLLHLRCLNTVLQLQVFVLGSAETTKRGCLRFACRHGGCAPSFLQARNAFASRNAAVDSHESSAVRYARCLGHLFCKSSNDPSNIFNINYCNAHVDFLQRLDGASASLVCRNSLLAFSIRDDTCCSPLLRDDNCCSTFASATTPFPSVARLLKTLAARLLQARRQLLFSSATTSVDVPHRMSHFPFLISSRGQSGPRVGRSMFERYVLPPDFVRDLLHRLFYTTTATQLNVLRDNAANSARQPRLFSASSSCFKKCWLWNA